MPTDPFATYLATISAARARGNATEHTYRPALEVLLRAIAPGLSVTNEPKRAKFGAPDFVIANPAGLIVGHVEAKDIGVSLDEIERDAARATPVTREGQQLRRYRAALPNLILTDYCDFRWWIGDERQAAAHLARPASPGKVTAQPGGAAAVRTLLEGFLAVAPQGASSPRDLAERMARLTHLIRDSVAVTLTSGEASDLLTDLHTGFKETLIPDLDNAAFADMYAQTLAYGLFAARANHAGPGFRRRDAGREIPRTNPFLRKLFDRITGEDLDDEPYAGLVDALAQLLAVTDMGAVLANFGKRTRQEDPVVHFYETFLAAYDPKIREARGVYYTPEPVVSYIVRSVDHLLKTCFACPAGLADTSTTTHTRTAADGSRHEETAPRVLILDPACGTGTFLYSVVDQIRASFRDNAGLWQGYVPQHLLPRLFGFELLMAPYAVAHLKLGLQLAGQDLPPDERAVWAYQFTGNERLSVYLTNTLDEAREIPRLPFSKWIADEANAASAVKRDFPIMVVLGNPPYAGVSANISAWIESLMEDYKITVRKEERQIQRLSNDYVKFIRFAQWRLERTGRGILSFITDSGYLNGLLFRDMRRSLLATFSDIYIYNLHGVSMRGPFNALGDDENVFDIPQGVAISIFVKTPEKPQLANVYYADLWGTRESKYETLTTWDVSSTSWQQIIPRPPYWHFVPLGSDETYEAWPLFTDIIGTGSPREDRDERYGTGIKTRHDEFVIGWSPEDAVSRVKRIANRSESDGELIQTLKLCTTSHFNIMRARLRATASDLSQYVQPIQYRPFDERYTVYLREFVCEPKVETMRHLLYRNNLALGVLRRDRKELGAGYFVARGLIAKDLISNLDDALIWPLYLYPDKPGELYSRATAIEAAKKAIRTGGQVPAAAVLAEQERVTALIKRLFPEPEYPRWPNFAPDFLAAVEERLELQFVPDGRGDLRASFGPEDLFHYGYAILHAPSYRGRYAEFLKMDFPRVPLTGDLALFRTLAALGAELVEWHLLDPARLATVAASDLPRYPITVADSQARDRVEPGYPKYVAPGEAEPGTNTPLAAGRVYINKTQYFAGVAPDVWAFPIGGYQPAEKWLKDRRGRQLTHADLLHYRHVCAALSATRKLMERIDAAIPGWPLP